MSAISLREVNCALTHCRTGSVITDGGVGQTKPVSASITMGDAGS